MILYTKFALDQHKGALELARFIIEQPNESNQIEYDLNQTMVNRKVLKFIQDKVLGKDFEVFSEKEELHVL